MDDETQRVKKRKEFELTRSEFRGRQADGVSPAGGDWLWVTRFVKS